MIDHGSLKCKSIQIDCNGFQKSMFCMLSARSGNSSTNHQNEINIPPQIYNKSMQTIACNAQILNSHINNDPERKPGTFNIYKARGQQIDATTRHVCQLWPGGAVLPEGGKWRINLWRKTHVKIGYLKIA